jgi:hypothetical protein
MSGQPRTSFHCDPAGEFVDLQVDEATGLTPPYVITIPTAEVERIYTTLRAAQLGVDPWGNL